MKPVAGLTLPLRFDAERLRSDLRLIGPEEWSPHFNDADFGGVWRGVALRSEAGSGGDIVAGPAGHGRFADTPLRDRCSYFSEVLAEFRCKLKSARLLSLEPGSFVREHSDAGLAFEDGEARIHIPIDTSDAVDFRVRGERLLLEPGGCYYVNVHLPHRVSNRGSRARVHLVIDAEVNDWIRDLFARGEEIRRGVDDPRGFAAFAELVFRDRDLRENLRAVPTKRDLIAALVREGAARGFSFHEGDVDAGVRGGTPGEGWIPWRITTTDPEPEATWIYPPEHRFTEPFFEDSVRVCLRSPFTSLFRRDMKIAAVPERIPRGFLFHMSRCGSTLTSRSLAAAESMHVISEAPPIDDVLNTGNTEWFRDIVSALGRAGKQYVIKLDSWHVRSLPLIRAVFPAVPWVFLYRDPIDVITSQLRLPGIQAIPGAMDPARLGMDLADITQTSRQRWCERVFAGFFEAALAHKSDKDGLFLDYRELPEAILGRVARHFGLEFSEEERAQIEAATRMDAKNPSIEFGARKPATEAPEPSAGLDRLRELYAMCQAG